MKKIILLLLIISHQLLYSVGLEDLLRDLNNKLKALQINLTKPGMMQAPFFESVQGSLPQPSQQPKERRERQRKGFMTKLAPELLYQAQPIQVASNLVEGRSGKTEQYLLNKLNVISGYDLQPLKDPMNPAKIGFWIDYVTARAFIADVQKEAKDFYNNIENLFYIYIVTESNVQYPLIEDEQSGFFAYPILIRLHGNDDPEQFISQEGKNNIERIRQRIQKIQSEVRPGFYEI